MNIVLKQNILLDTLQNMVGLSTTKQTTNIANNLLIETKTNKVKITNSNIDTTIISFLEASINNPGKAVVFAKQILSIVRELPAKEIKLELIKQ